MITIKLDTTINPGDPSIYQAIATVHDPRTDEGMEDDPVEDRTNQSRVRAMQFAQDVPRQHPAPAIHHGCVRGIFHF